MGEASKLEIECVIFLFVLVMLVGGGEGYGCCLTVL